MFQQRKIHACLCQYFILMVKRKIVNRGAGYELELAVQSFTLEHNMSLKGTAMQIEKILKNNG